eukprot:16470_1
MSTNQKYSTAGSGDARYTWQQLSAQKCAANESCSCCTLTCCGLFVLVLWIIGGALAAWGAQTSIQLLEDGTFVTAYDDACCSSETDICSDECCVGMVPTGQGDYEMTYHGITCDDVEPILTLTLADGVLSCIAGVCGIVGICAFVTNMLLIPFLYSIVAIGISIVGMAILDTWFAWNGWVNIVISCLIVYLFYMNWRIMKDAKSSNGV